MNGDPGKIAYVVFYFGFGSIRRNGVRNGISSVCAYTLLASIHSGSTSHVDIRDTLMVTSSHDIRVLGSPGSWFVMCDGDDRTPSRRRYARRVRKHSTLVSLRHNRIRMRYCTRCNGHQRGWFGPTFCFVGMRRQGSVTS